MADVQVEKPRCPKCGSEMIYELHRKGAATEYRRWRCGRCRYLKAHHGLTMQAYEQVLTQQGGGCAICGSVEALVIDHDHSCCPAGKSCEKCRRGLLCNNCNRGLGLWRDNPAVIASAIVYLLSVRGI